MLYQRINIGESGLLGIWKIDETMQELEDRLEHREWLIDILTVKSEVKRAEKLVVRLLLKELIGEEKEISYSLYGKPFLTDKSFNLSISHTKGYAAVILDKEHDVGIDIEQITDKVKRVRSKFVSDKEFISEDDELIHLLLHWTAKETIYKILDTPDIELKEEVIIDKFKPSEQSCFKATDLRNNQQLDIHYEIDPDFVLAYLVVN